MIKPEIKLQNEQILDGIAAGDENVLKSIFRDYKAKIIAFLKKDNATTEEAEDIFMSSLEIIYHSLLEKKLTLDKATFKTYFTPICLFQWGKIKRRKKFTGYVTKARLKVYIDVIDYENEWVEHQRMVLFRTKMSNLSDECSKILGWYLNQEKSLSEMSVLLGISEGALRKRKYDCKERLFKMVQSDPLYHELI